MDFLNNLRETFAKLGGAINEPPQFKAAGEMLQKIGDNLNDYPQVKQFREMLEAARDALNDQPQLKQAREMLDKAVAAVSPKDSEQVLLLVERADQQDVWNDVFSTKLIEVLDKLDEIRDGVRNSLSESSAIRQNTLKRLDELESFIAHAAEQGRAARERAEDVDRRLEESAVQTKVSLMALRKSFAVLAGGLGALAIGLVWALWAALRPEVAPVWAPAAASAAIVIATVYCMAIVRRET